MDSKTEILVQAAVRKSGDDLTQLIDYFVGRGKVQVIVDRGLLGNPKFEYTIAEINDFLAEEAEEKRLAKSKPEKEEVIVVFDIESASLRELREKAKEKSIPNYWSMNEETLREKLLELDEEENDADSNT